MSFLAHRRNLLGVNEVSRSGNRLVLVRTKTGLTAKSLCRDDRVLCRGVSPAAISGLRSKDPALASLPQQCLARNIEY